MTQKERIDALEREIELLKAQVAGLLARPQYVPMPQPYQPQPPYRVGTPYYQPNTSAAAPRPWGQTFNVNDGGF